MAQTTPAKKKYDSNKKKAYNFIKTLSTIIALLHEMDVSKDQALDAIQALLDKQEMN